MFYIKAHIIGEGKAFRAVKGGMAGYQSNGCFLQNSDAFQGVVWG